MHATMVKLHSVISSAITGLTVEDMARCSEEKWSVAEILEHLNLTYIGTIKNMERRLAEGKPAAAADRSAKRWHRITVTRLGYFPPGGKSPERVTPRGTPAQQVVEQIFENISRLDDAIARCEAQFPSGCAIAEHPLLGPLTPTEWRGFHLTHGRHHVKQVLALKRKFVTR
jgi:hypothetical protein